MKMFSTKNLIVVLFVSALLFNADLISGNSLPPNDDYLAFAQVMPTPVGGYPEIYKKIEYPQSAIRLNVQGKVYIMAFVDENGDVSECTVLRGIGSGCDEAAVNAISSTKFTPGMNDNKAVKVKVSLTIVFQLKS